MGVSQETRALQLLPYFKLGESSDSHFPNCAAVSVPIQDIASAVVLLYNFQVW